MSSLQRLLSTVVVVVLLLIGPLTAQANIIYDWIGDCQRLDEGSGTLYTHATLHVVTTDAYIPGEEFFPGFPPGCGLPNPTPAYLSTSYRSILSCGLAASVSERTGRMIDRRTFLGGTGSVLLAAPLAARAQQATKVTRIRFLGLASASSFGKQTKALRD